MAEEEEEETSRIKSRTGMAIGAPLPSAEMLDGAGSDISRSRREVCPVRHPLPPSCGIHLTRMRFQKVRSRDLENEPGVIIEDDSCGIHLAGGL